MDYLPCCEVITQTNLPSKYRLMLGGDNVITKPRAKARRGQALIHTVFLSELFVLLTFYYNSASYLVAYLLYKCEFWFSLGECDGL